MFAGASSRLEGADREAKRVILVISSVLKQEPGRVVYLMSIAQQFPYHRRPNRFPNRKVHKVTIDPQVITTLPTPRPLMDDTGT